MMFMKGDKKAPFCKFSKQSVELLNELNIEYGSFDILTDEEVRQGLKEYSNWPTYPQLYVEGELIGGVDIMKEMKEDGSLLELISEEHRVKPRESQDEKYRKIPLDNAAFKKRVSGLVGGIALLKAVGFVKSETHLELPLAARDANKALLEETLAKLEKAHAAYCAGAC